MKRLFALAAGTCLFATPAFAVEHAVTNLDSPVPAGESWGSLPGENSGTTEITASTALESNGSLHLSGDRTRVQTGIQYNGFATNLGVTADQLFSYTGDFIVNDGGGNAAGTGGIQSPAFRVYLNNATTNQRSELIWEAAYNGGYTTGAKTSLSSDGIFWRYIAGCGAVIQGGGCGSGTYEQHTLEAWGDLIGNGWYLSALGVGNGSGAGLDFDALVDNLTLSTTNANFGTQSYDFQVEGAVPEPATWLMMIVGFGAVGSQLRRKRTNLARA